jgi:pyridoxal phosphate enzyme (YggS family)
MNISENIARLKKEIPDNIKIIAISKTKSPARILDAYNSGHRLFGENRVQELTEKSEILPKDIQWHMVGHLQTNKVKFIIPFVSLIHSIDSMKLLKIVNAESLKNNKIQDCLFQLHIAREETKFGLSETELKTLLSSQEFQHLHNVRMVGLMGMATFTDQESIIRNEFRSLSRIFKEVKNDFFPEQDYFCELSMGMSADYKIAIEEGTTMIRVGTIIFGERNGSKCEIAKN